MRLRGYQTEAIEQLRAKLRDGMRRLLLVAPTGSGKTVIGAAIISFSLERGKTVLFLAHRRELIKQAWCKLVRSGVEPSRIGVILPGVAYPRESSFPLGGFGSLNDDELWSAYSARNPSAPVQVASIQTLVRREIPTVDVVMVDEAHRSRAASYERVVAANDGAAVIGLTATPIRTDGKSLAGSYDDLVVVAQYRELVEQGHLVEARAWSVPVEQEPDLSEVAIKGGDYDIVGLGVACNEPGLVGSVVEHWIRHGNNAPTFAFAAGVEHSRSIAAQFNEAGIPAAHVDGGTPTEERARILRDLGEGRIKVVSNCDVCTEGTDVPAVKTIILARPTKSLRVFLQMVGRGSRPHNGEPFVILDHAGACRQPGFGLPQDDREWSLTPKKRKRKSAAAPVKTCEVCWAILPLSSPLCPECGHEFPAPEPRSLEQIAGELIEIRRPTTADECKHVYDLVVEQWKAKNSKREVPMSPGWVAHRYKEIAGTWPPSSFRAPKLSEQQAAVRRRFDELKSHEEKNGLAHGWAHAVLACELG